MENDDIILIVVEKLCKEIIELCSYKIFFLGLGYVYCFCYGVDFFVVMILMLGY